jgi:hypothetical protein
MRQKYKHVHGDEGDLECMVSFKQSRLQIGQKYLSLLKGTQD